MIPRTHTQNTDWKHELRQAINQPEELLDLLELPKSQWLAAANRAAQKFALKIPRNFLELMEKGNANDPLLRQFLPLAEELNKVTGYSSDPVGDDAATSVPGLIHKYQNRALLVTTGACAVNCRYCFRRHYPYSDSHAGGTHTEEIIQYLTEHTDINEAILSGGDPLMLDDARLAQLLKKIANIPHIRWIRLHSRLPIVLPERVTTSLTDALNCKKSVSIIIHCNHTTELGYMQQDALQRLQQAGIRLYNQSVLLKGVNDNADQLTELSHKLYDNGVQPYYLHMLDKVQGASHFDLPKSVAVSIYKQMQSQLSGLMLPRLVSDHANEPAKTIINI